MKPSAQPAKKKGALLKTPAGPSRKKILLVDDHPMMRAGLAQLVNQQADLIVCAEAGNPAETQALLSQVKPDLILTDLTMPGRGGIEFIKDLIALDPDIAILVVSMHDELVYAERCLKAGARGYIMKESGSENLLIAVRRVLGGQTYVSANLGEQIVRNLSSRKPRGSDSPIQSLSDREFEIFQLVGQGKSTREIAEQLHLSPKTVDVHRTHIREKLQLKDVNALMHYAVRWLETQSPST